MFAHSVLTQRFALVDTLARSMFEIGNSLREARLRRRIDLVEAEQDTKIRSKYLAALEGEEFDVLPGSVYARGFLRTYAHYLGLDSQLYIDEYNARFGRFEEVDDPLARRVRQLGDQGRRRGLLSLRSLAIASLLALAALTWLGLRQGDRDAPGTTELLRPVVQAATDGATLNDRFGAADRHQRTAAPVPTVARLAITTPNGDSWIEVRLGSRTGRLLYAGTMQQGARRTFTGKRLLVNVGFPPATELRLSGRKGRLRPTSGNAVRYLVTPTRISVTAS